jgi:hypothetical protein
MYFFISKKKGGLTKGSKDETQAHDEIWDATMSKIATKGISTSKVKKKRGGYCCYFEPPPTGRMQRSMFLRIIKCSNDQTSRSGGSPTWIPPPNLPLWNDMVDHLFLTSFLRVRRSETDGFMPENFLFGLGQRYERVSYGCYDCSVFCERIC